MQDRDTGLKTEISIPFDNHSADETLKELEFGSFGNLPYEEVPDINGHSCVSILGIIQHIFAHQIPIGFTEETDGSLPTRRTRNTHGYKAMQELLATMKRMDVNEEPTKYGSFILWSDGFIT